jgi:anti-sigma B factor antagonist
MNCKTKMNINLSNQSGIIIAEIHGEIDANTAPLIQQKVAPLFTPESQLLLNLTHVEYMSSAGLRILLTLHRYATANHCKLVLVGLSEEVADVMAVTGFLNFFTTCNTIEAALTTLNGNTESSSP